MKQPRYPRKIEQKLKTYYYLNLTCLTLGIGLMNREFTRKTIAAFFAFGVIAWSLNWQLRVVQGKGKFNRSYWDYSWLLNRRFSFRPPRIYCDFKLVDIVGIVIVCIGLHKACERQSLRLLAGVFLMGIYFFLDIGRPQPKINWHASKSIGSIYDGATKWLGKPSDEN